ncbi:MAG: ferredoxin--NADP reductase, partial [Acidimicrobiales bacterium]
MRKELGGPSSFAGSRPRGRPRVIARAARERMEDHWVQADRYNRRARVTGVERLTTTGTVRLTLEVADDRPFHHLPGNFVGIECWAADLGWRRSPYCIVSPPSDDGRFQLLVRVVPDGPVASYLGSLEVGDIVTFRGPTGRTMIPRWRDRDLVLVGTGVGIGPLVALARYLLPQPGFDHEIELFWGLRQEEDLCLLDELEDLATEFPNFTYRITLTQPPAAWTGLRGRVTQSMPTLLHQIADKRFILCGNAAMMEELRAALSDVGVNGDLIYDEPYFN